MFERPVGALLAAHCIEHDHELLHRDPDFDALESPHGLKVWRH
jgi:predicted nucleic acid-binding protein